jgi:hypothetical protein
MPISSQPSALVRQLSDKVRTQAERLTSLDAYRVLLERRLQELDPKHPLPVLPQHLTQRAFSAPEMPPNVVDLKKQLAIREQDLTYAKQRNEKLANEIESMKREGGAGGASIEEMRMRVS